MLMHTLSFILFHTALYASRMIFINSQLLFLDIFSGCIQYNGRCQKVKIGGSRLWTVIPLDPFFSNRQAGCVLLPNAVVPPFNNYSPFRILRIPPFPSTIRPIMINNFLLYVSPVLATGLSSPVDFPQLYLYFCK